MNAEQFLEPEKVTAEEFLTSRSFTDKALDFLTMGHVMGEYGPEKEVSFDAEGNMITPYATQQKPKGLSDLVTGGKIDPLGNVPTGDPGFFQDPVTALAMGGAAGVRAASKPLLAAGREALGWFTGGGSEIPQLAKAGAKGITRVAEIPALAETAAKRAGKPFAEVPVKATIAEPASRVVAEAAPRAANEGAMYWPEGDEAKSIFAEMKSELRGGQTKSVNEIDGETFVTGSSYPQWFRDISKKHKLSATETTSFIDKYLLQTVSVPKTFKGTLTDRQGAIYNDIVTAAHRERGKYAGMFEGEELAKEGFVQPINKIDAASLKVGDELVRRGEKFKVTGEDADGFLTIKDGETFRVGPDDVLPFDHIKRGKPEVQTDIEGMGFRDTFDLTNPQTEISRGLKLQTNLSPNSLIPEVRGGATGELPKYAEGSAINLERLNTTEDVRQFINVRTQEAEKTIGKHPVTWEQTRAQAEALGWDTRAIRKEWDKKGAFSAAEIDATRQTNLNAITELQKEIKELPYEQTTLTPELRAKFLDTMDLIRVTSQAASETGRALNIHKRILSNDPAFKQASEMERVLKAITGKGAKRTDELIQGLREIDFNNTAEVNRFIYNATKTPWQKLSNGAFELWINGLLSNPLTHIVNTTSNALTMAYQYPERLLGASIEAVRAKATGTTKGIFFGETTQDIFSISKGLQDAVARFGHAMRYGERVTKLDYPPSALPDKIARLLPTRALVAEDAFFKGFIENQELNRLAYRKAAKEGLQGEAFKQRVTNLLIHPEEQMLNDVAKRGQYLTYQKEVGEVGRLIFNARDKVPGLKYFIPFVKTPLNIAKFALERTPLNFGRLAARAAKGELKGAQLSEELAKPIMGTMLGTTTYQLAEQGYITGGTPKNAAERNEKLATGWQPYSVKIGDTYYSYGRLEPLGSIMGMAADMSQIKGEMHEKENFNLAAAIMGSITNNISNKTFMQGFTNMIQGISDPGRYGANIVKQLAGSVVPAVSGGVARAIDPNVRDTRSIADTLQSRIPIAAESLPPKLTVWGEPLERPGTPISRMLSPMQISQEKGSPIEKELTKLDLDIGYPSRKIKDFEIPAEDYWKMVKSAGEPAKKILDKLATSEKWLSLPDKIKEKTISSVVSQFRDAEARKYEAKLIHEGKIKAVNW